MVVLMNVLTTPMMTIKMRGRQRRRQKWWWQGRGRHDLIWRLFAHKPARRGSMQTSMAQAGPRTSTTHNYWNLSKRDNNQIELTDCRLERVVPSDKKTPKVTAITGSEAVSIGPVRHKATHYDEEVHSCIAWSQQKAISLSYRHSCQRVIEDPINIF